MLIDKTKICNVSKHETHQVNDKIVEIKKKEFKIFNFIIRKSSIKYGLKDYCKTFGTKEELFDYYYSPLRFFIEGDRIMTKPSIVITFINKESVTFYVEF